MLYFLLGVFVGAMFVEGYYTLHARNAKIQQIINAEIDALHK